KNIAKGEILKQVPEAAVLEPVRLAVHNQESGLVPTNCRSLRDLVWGQVKIKIRGSHVSKESWASSWGVTRAEKGEFRMKSRKKVQKTKREIGCEYLERYLPATSS